MLYYCFVFLIQISLLASLTAYFREKQDLYLRLFPLFLLITDIIEVVSEYMAAHGHHNVAIYNSFMPFEFGFYLFVLMRIIRNKKVKKVLQVFIVAFLLLAAYYILFGEKNAFNSRPYLVGALLIVATCIFYFIELFRLPNSPKLARQPSFWICSGLLFFYACTFPIYGLVNLYIKAPHIIIMNTLSIIYILNVFLYSSFTIAFLCGIKTRKSIS